MLAAQHQAGGSYELMIATFDCPSQLILVHTRQPKPIDIEWLSFSKGQDMSGIKPVSPGVLKAARGCSTDGFMMQNSLNAAKDAIWKTFGPSAASAGLSEVQQGHVPFFAC